MLPLSVLEQAAEEMIDVHGTGQSAMEMSHRSKYFKPIIEKAEKLLRELMCIPDNYKVLFLQGGASLQFSMVPLNLAGVEQGEEKKQASFIDTGIWAGKAFDEAKKFVNPIIRASSKDKKYTCIPCKFSIEPQDAFCHITLNNTIVGTKWHYIPDTGRVPLVADISSCILSEPLDISKFGVLYAGAQKNLGPAGTTVVIVREDLIGKAPSWTPALLRYDIHAQEASLYNTPPCYGIYMISLVLEWLKRSGGVEAIMKINQEKASLFYEYLERSLLFHSPVVPEARSLMNIPFINGDKELEERFIREAETVGLVNLAGHRLVGGLRASIYNAMPIEGVQKLITFAEDFEKRNTHV
jgi:phosphoserine aminotransferase